MPSGCSEDVDCNDDRGCTRLAIGRVDQDELLGRACDHGFAEACYLQAVAAGDRARYVALCDAGNVRACLDVDDARGPRLAKDGCAAGY